MKVNNGNFGTINSDGGNVTLGNTYNIFDGIAALSQEYKEQIKAIENLIYAFKPKTALVLLEDLKKRIKESDVQNKNRVLAKITYLEGLCKNELREYSREESAKTFIQAYNLNKEDIDIKKRACVEYKYLNQIPKALELADELLQLDEFGVTAWYVKASVSEDLKSFLSTIPDTVRSNRTFQHSIIYDIVATKNLQFLEDLQDYGMELEFNPDDYIEVLFTNKGLWIVGIDLYINKLFNDLPVRYVTGDKLIMKETSQFKKVFELLTTFIAALKYTEIKDTIAHQKFLYNYLGYLIYHEPHFVKSLEESYAELENMDWFYLSCLCQVINTKKDYSKSLEYINGFETAGGNATTEFYIFKAVILSLLERYEESSQAFHAYLNLIDAIDERQGLNIVNNFLRIFWNNVSEEHFESLVKAVSEKQFKNEVLQTLINATAKVRYTTNYDGDAIKVQLEAISNDQRLDENYKNLIAENLHALGDTPGSISFMETYLDKTAISPSLRLFILLLTETLHDKSDKKLTGRYKELLHLLKFWRTNNVYIDVELLAIEHDLYYVINDWQQVSEIDTVLHNNFPDNEEYLYRYMISLEKSGQKDKITALAATIADNFDNEGLGLTISTILLRNNDTEKGFTILYNLASNKNNSNARGLYFGTTLQFSSFFKNYDVVCMDNWVTYQLPDAVHKTKIETDKGLHKQLLGKKLNEEFKMQGGIAQKEIDLKVIEITNDALNLFREISEEAKNPFNGMGIHSFNIDENTDILEFLKQNFGESGTENKNTKAKYLGEYYNFKIGFSEVSRMVFEEHYIDAYFHLTNVAASKFTTLPVTITNAIDLSPETVFALDFSSLVLFYLLETGQGFVFKHTYRVSYLVKSHIEEEIVHVRNSPESPLSVQVTNESVEKYFTPDNYKEKRLEFLNSILGWVNDRCTIDLVPEKLDITLKLKYGETKEKFMGLVVDNLFISNRPQHHLISSDVTVFRMAGRNNDLFCNVISPEKYLLQFNKEKVNYEFYKFLLQSNYLGITINAETLKMEYFKLLADDQNYYYDCLKNIEFYINPDPAAIEVVIGFLSDIYLEASISAEDKNKCATEVIQHIIYGMPREVLLKFYDKLTLKLSLLGQVQFTVSQIFYNCVKKMPPLPLAD